MKQKRRSFMYTAFSLFVPALFFGLLFLSGGVLVNAQSDSFEVSQTVQNCVVNNICEDSENANTCPSDCNIACNDNIDNDGDGFVDFPNDPQCDSVNDTTETAQNNNNNDDGGGGGPLLDPESDDENNDDQDGGDSSSDDGNENDLRIFDVKVVATSFQAEVTWSTQKETQSRVLWGSSREYAEGSLANTKFQENHKVILTDLTPGQVYYFRIEAETRAEETESASGSFITQSLEGDPLPPNVENFRILDDPDGLLLTWQNPDDEAFDDVWVVRSENGFPGGPEDGRNIYRGTDDTFLDTGVSSGVRYYYGVFVKSDRGVFSSGVVSARVKSASEDTQEQDDFEDSIPGEDIGGQNNNDDVEDGVGNEDESADEADTEPDLSGSSDTLLDLSDFLFIQKEGTHFATQGNIVKLQSEFAFSVLLPNSLISQDIEQIIFRRSNELTNAKNNYTLKTETDGNAARAYLPAYFETGQYPFEIYIILTDGDYYTLSGALSITDPEENVASESTFEKVAQTLTDAGATILLFGILFLLLAASVLFFRR